MTIALLTSLHLMYKLEFCIIFLAK